MVHSIINISQNAKCDKLVNFPSYLYLYEPIFTNSVAYVVDCFISGSIPEEAKILALTATATAEVLSTVKTKLNLVDPLVIGLSPKRDNIKYYVEPLPKLDILCQLLCEGLNQHRNKFPKTLIFCRTIAECATLYKNVRDSLGGAFTEPAGYPNYHCFRLLRYVYQGMFRGNESKSP